MKKTVTAIDPLIAEFEKLETELAAIKPTEYVRVPFEVCGKWFELCFEHGVLFIKDPSDDQRSSAVEDQDPLVLLAAAIVTDVFVAKVRATTVTNERIQKAIEFMQRRNAKEGTNEQR